MFTKIRNRLARLGDAKSSDAEARVDISRVLPGYTPVDGQQTDLSDKAVSDTDHEADADTLVLTQAVASEDTEPFSDDDFKAQNTKWLERDLNRLYATWDDAKDAPEKLKFVVRANHDLKGMAGTYGFPAISRLATSLDQLLNSERALANPALINLHIEACRAAFAEGKAGDAGSAVADSVCVALEEQVNRAVS